jgi:hypothetical protein
MTLDSTEWSAVISAVAVIASGSASAFLTYRITQRSLDHAELLADRQRKNDNGERELHRKADTNREFGVRLFERRVDTAIAYLSYMADRTREAISLGETVIAGRMEGLDTNGLRDLLSHRAIAGVLLLMPDNVIYNVQAALTVLTDTAEAIEKARDVRDEMIAVLRSFPAVGGSR